MICCWNAPKKPAKTEQQLSLKESRVFTRGCKNEKNFLCCLVYRRSPGRSRSGIRFLIHHRAGRPAALPGFPFSLHVFPARFFTSFPVTNGLLTNEKQQKLAPRKLFVCVVLIRTFSALLIQNSSNVWFTGRSGSIWPGSAVCMCGNSASCHRQLAQRLLGHRRFCVL